MAGHPWIWASVDIRPGFAQMVRHACECENESEGEGVWWGWKNAIPTLVKHPRHRVPHFGQALRHGSFATGVIVYTCDNVSIHVKYFSKKKTGWVG